MSVSGSDSNDFSTSEWLERLQDGDQEALGQIWSRIEPRLVQMARRQLDGVPRRIYDENDLALSTLNAFYVGAREGRFASLKSRDNLWRLLKTILTRKASNRRRYLGARREVGESEIGARLHELIEDEKVLEVLTSEASDLLERLEPKLREVALMKFSGLSNDEIAREIGRAPRTITRYLDLIRSTWSE